MNHSPQLDSFESALLSELRREVEQHPAPAVAPPAARGPRRRLRWAAVAATGVAASVVAAFGLGSGGGSPAYAVERDSSGDVIVTVHRLEDAAGLQSALRAQGIDADVSYDSDVTTGPGQQASLGSGPAATGTSAGVHTQHHDQGGPVTSGQDPEPEGTALCGPLDPAPATLTHSGGDWVLDLPAGSPLQDRHIVIGTGPDGALSVEFAGDQPGTYCRTVSGFAPGTP